MKIPGLVFLGWIAMALSGCLEKPDDVIPVSSFNPDRYLGQWYEIARLDQYFERGLSNVSATYSLRDDGGIRVVNRGYSDSDQSWQEVEGKAYFVEGRDKGYLKVSFFGPFYAPYVVFGLDTAQYGYAFVAGGSKDDLWLLAKTPQVNDSIKQDFISRAKTLGFATDKLIWVDQSKNLSQ